MREHPTSGEHDFLPVAPLIKAGNMGTAAAALDRKLSQRGGLRKGSAEVSGMALIMHVSALAPAGPGKIVALPWFASKRGRSEKGMHHAYPCRE
jgi:hypothetical protein